MPETLTFQVAVESTERLDRFLANQLSISRTQSARLVAGGAVTAMMESCHKLNEYSFSFLDYVLGP